MAQSYADTHDGSANWEPHGGMSTAVTAAGAGDNAEVLGDRHRPHGSWPRWAYCAMVVTKVKAVIGASESIAVTSKLRHGDNSDGTTGWADYVPLRVTGSEPSPS